MTLEQIKATLADRNLSKVAETTGLNVHTLYRIVQGKCKPHRATLRVLVEYLVK